MVVWGTFVSDPPSKLSKTWDAETCLETRMRLARGKWIFLETPYPDGGDDWRESWEVWSPKLSPGSNLSFWQPFRPQLTPSNSWKNLMKIAQLDGIVHTKNGWPERCWCFFCVVRAQKWKRAKLLDLPGYSWPFNQPPLRYPPQKVQKTEKLI